MNRRVLRFDVPAIDRVHRIRMHPGPITRVAIGRGGDLVGFWTEQHLDQDKIDGLFRVVRTGQTYDLPWLLCGTTPPHDGVVFHLIGHWDEAPQTDEGAKP